MRKWLRFTGDLIKRWLSASFSFIIFAAIVVFVWAGIRALFSDTFLIICVTIPLVILVCFVGLMLIGLIVTILRLIFGDIADQFRKDWRIFLWTSIVGTLLSVFSCCCLAPTRRRVTRRRDRLGFRVRCHLIKIQRSLIVVPRNRL